MHDNPPIVPPEPTTARGEVLLSHNHICILNGLYDRPDGASASTVDMTWAARPYLRAFRRDGAFSFLGVVAMRMHDSWVSTEKIATRRVWRLEERGRAILELEVPAHIKGYGRYRGMVDLRKEVAAEWEELDRRIAGHVEASASLDPWREAIAELVFCWRDVLGSDGTADAVVQNAQGSALDAYLRSYVLEHGGLPWGAHEIPAAPGKFVVNFDELR